MRPTIGALLVGAMAMLVGAAGPAPERPAPERPAPAKPAPARPVSAKPASGPKPDFALHGLPPIPSDAAVMALARKALGKPCHFRPRLVGPEVADFTRLPPSVGQMPMAGGFIFVRQRGAQRVAFLAIERSEEDQCRIVDVQPLPPAIAKEAFLDCLVDNPDPKIIPPISHGLGLRQNGVKAPVAYLEADIKTGRLTPRTGDDKRIRCSAFESGD